MTDKRERIQLVLGLIFICLTSVGILGYQMREVIPRINKRVATEPIDGQLVYLATRGKVCLVSGLDFQCTALYSVSNPDMPDLTPLPSESSFAEIYKRTGLLEIDGEESILLTEAALVPYRHPRWSPDRQLIAYAGGPGLCLADADGDNEECYPTDAQGISGISWSPDGQKIAFSRRRFSGVGWDVFIFDLDTRSATLFIENADDPSWSPDGQQLAFTLEPAGNYEIYTIDLDGSNLRRITYDSADDYNPAWSPDGDQIAFVSERSGEYRYLTPFALEETLIKRIYVVDAEGGEAQVLISETNNSIERFVWGE